MRKDLVLLRSPLKTSGSLIFPFPPGATGIGGGSMGGFQEVLVGSAPVVLGGLVGSDLDLLRPLGKDLVVPG